MASEEEPDDRDIEGLKMVCEGLEITSERMRKSALEFAWDKYILQPLRDAKKLRERERLDAE